MQHAGNFRQAGDLRFDSKNKDAGQNHQVVISNAVR